MGWISLEVDTIIMFMQYSTALLLLSIGKGHGLKCQMSGIANMQLR